MKKVLIFSFIIIFSLAFFNFAQAEWEEPSADPPGGNVSPPLNQGSTDQYKEGGLLIGDNSTFLLGGDNVFGVDGASLFNGELTIGSGNLIVSSGSATISSGLTVSSGGLTVSSGNLIVSSGSATISNGLTVSSGNLTVSSGSATIGSGLTVSSGNLTVSSGSATISSGLTVSSGNLVISNGKITANASLDSDSVASIENTSANITAIAIKGTTNNGIGVYGISEGSSGIGVVGQVLSGGLAGRFDGETVFHTFPVGNGTTTIIGGNVLIEDDASSTEIIGGNIITDGPIEVGGTDSVAGVGDVYVSGGLSTVHSGVILDDSSPYQDETIVTDILCLGASGEFYSYDGTSCRDAWDGPGPENWFIFRESTDLNNLGHSYFNTNDYQEGNIRIDGIIEVKCQDGEDPINSGILIGDAGAIYDSSCDQSSQGTTLHIQSYEKIEIESTVSGDDAIKLVTESGGVYINSDLTTVGDAFVVGANLDVTGKANITGDLDVIVGDAYIGGFLNMQTSKIINLADPENNLDAVNLQTLNDAIDGIVSGDDDWTIDGDNIYHTPGNVGIGTTGPFSKLSFGSTNDNVTSRIALYEGLNGTYFYGVGMANPSSSQYGLGLWGGTGDGVIPTNTNMDIFIKENGNVGIGTTSPIGKLQVNGTLNEKVYIVTNSGIDTMGCPFVVSRDTSGDEEIRLWVDDSTAFFHYLNDEETNKIKFRLQNTGSESGTANDNIVMTLVGDGDGGGVEIPGKLTVGTIDPIYVIAEERYATYGHSTIGVKEEVLGKININEKIKENLYLYKVDFSKQEKGSDLWLFNEITDFGKNWQNLIVMLTPEGQADVWYEIEAEKDLLMIYSDQPVYVSYRLVAPRFDNQKHPTYLPDSDYEGLRVR